MWGVLTAGLTILFVGLKLCGKVEWSWLWVLSPLWISLILGILVVVVFFLGLPWIMGRVKKSVDTWDE